jgi:hypothetical protein
LPSRGSARASARAGPTSRPRRRRRSAGGSRPGGGGL